jgi:hypothetical protein
VYREQRNIFSASLEHNEAVNSEGTLVLGEKWIKKWNSGTHKTTKRTQHMMLSFIVAFFHPKGFGLSNGLNTSARNSGDLGPNKSRCVRKKKEANVSVDERIRSRVEEVNPAATLY